jgi:hypothetical protein
VNQSGDNSNTGNIIEGEGDDDLMETDSEEDETTRIPLVLSVLIPAPRGVVAW